MSRHDDLPRLKDMLAHAEEATRLSANRGRNDLTTDRLFGLAMIRLLEIVGEAAARVSEQTRAAYPDIQWGPIIGLRNRLIHGYGDIDYDIVWAIITHDLPTLANQLRHIPDLKS
jgi:uncharacterized protein with HEPN domain